MDEQEVVELMESSTSDQSWDDNADEVKRRCGGYPDFWYKAIIMSGLANRTTAKWGSDAGIHVVVQG